MSQPDPAILQAVEQALAERDIARAAALADGAVRAGQRDPMLLNLVAWQREEAGDFDAALVLLNEALELAPGDPTIIGAMGAVLRKQGRLGEALRQLELAIQLDPAAAAPWLERGMALEVGGSLEEAQASYRRAAELDPLSSSAFGGVASIAARRGDVDVALRFGRRALALNPLDPQGAAGMARVEIESGRLERAAEILKPVLASELGDENRSNLANLHGDALDRLGRYPEAFAAYLEANEASGRRLDRLYRDRETHREWVEQLEKAFAGVDCAWKASRTSLAVPAFLIGYPRSGTTLVENVLASIPGIEALEERPTLAAGDEYLRDGGIARLAKLKRAELDRLRLAYWDYVAGAGIDATGKLFIDKDPLKGLQLPLIARLFPDARIIVMRRDPRDVVWSCFRANFAPTWAAAEFTDLERAARHYDAVMRAQEAFLSTLPLATFELRYERLVSDFDRQTRKLCDFLGTAWSEHARGFAQTARRRGVSTLSASQVSKPLYDGSGQWRKYEEQLQPILPLLQPWVERFGYR